MCIAGEKGGARGVAMAASTVGMVSWRECGASLPGDVASGEESMVTVRWRQASGEEAGAIPTRQWQGDAAVWSDIESCASCALSGRWD